MQREKITFQPNKPVHARLDQSESKPIEGRNGVTDYMRVCDNDQRIIFAPEGLELAITESGATAGDVVQITQIGTGPRTTWDVAIVGEQPPARTNGKPQPAAAIATRERKPAPVAAREITADAAAMTAAYTAAIEATAAAEAYAQRAGLRDFRASSAEIITRVALSIYINHCEKEGRA